MTVKRAVKPRALLASIVVVAVGAGWFGVAAATDGPGDRSNERRTLTFVDETTAATLVDFNKNGAPDPGDTFVFHEQYVTAEIMVEYNDSTCTVGFEDNYLCHVVVVVVGRGQVVVDGSVMAPGGVFPVDFDLPVTGGSGDFATARGYARVHHVSDTVSRDTIVLLA